MENKYDKEKKVKRLRGFSKQVTKNPDGSITTITREFDPELNDLQ